MSFNPILKCTMVEVPMPEYEELVRDSEKVAAVKRLIAAGNYATVNDVAAILEIETEERKEKE